MSYPPPPQQGYNTGGQQPGYAPQQNYGAPNQQAYPPNNLPGQIPMQPQMQQPMHQQPMHQQPMQHQPMHQQPMHQQPMQQPMQPQMQQQPMHQQQPMQPQMQQQPMHQQQPMQPQMQPQPTQPQQPMQQQTTQPQQPMQQPVQQTAGEPSGQPWKPGATSDNGPNYKWDNVPDTDLDEKAPMQEDAEPDKPAAAFESIPGYENVAFNDGTSVPPPVYVPPPEEDKPPETYKASDTLSDDAVRSAILAFVDRQCCYGSKPAKEMNFDSIDPSSALHYQLETFTEGRRTRGAQEAYSGGYVDGPHCGHAPSPWQMNCQPSSMFQNHTKVLEVPHTSVVRSCYRCYGRGFLRCPRCYGRGMVRCNTCGGDGTRRVHRDDHWENERCYSCHGMGRKRCYHCGGDGRITCGTCHGYRSLRHYIELVVQYINHVEDYIMESTDLPDELIRDVSGQVLFEQTLPYVWPITQYPVQQINTSSMMIVNNHRKAWPTDRILQQRQVLRSVPVSEVKYTWKDHNKRFWVYGFEHDVHAPDYPHTCCWGCNVL